MPEPGRSRQALHQREGGILAPERCVAAHATAAAARGAVLREREAVTGWRVDADSGDALVTTARATYRGRRLVVTAGAWIPQLVPQLRARPGGPGRVQGVRDNSFHASMLMMWMMGKLRGGTSARGQQQVWHPHDWLASAHREAAWVTAINHLPLSTSSRTGAWPAQDLCTVERQVVAWFGDATPDFDPAVFPVFVLHDEELGYYYGFPSYGNAGLKIGALPAALSGLGYGRVG